MPPSLSLSAYSIIWSTSAIVKCSPTEEATLSKSVASNIPFPVGSKASYTDWRVPSELEFSLNPKMLRKVPKSISPWCPLV